MKLWTKALERKAAKLPIESQDEKLFDAEVICEIFNPYGSEKWIIVAAEHTDDDIMLYGYFHVLDWEWGFISLSELESIRIDVLGHGYPMSLERNLYLPNGATVKDCIK